MKIVMGDKDNDLWLILGPEYKRYDEIIIDRKRKDVRVRIGNEVAKIRYEEAGLTACKIKDILVNDIFVYQPNKKIKPQKVTVVYDRMNSEVMYVFKGEEDQDKILQHMIKDSGNDKEAVEAFINERVDFYEVMLKEV